MTPLLRGYLLAMAAPAVVLTAMLVGGPSTAPGDPVLMVVLLLLGAVASNFPVMVSPRLKTDAAPAVYLMTAGGIGILFSGRTHDERSKSMNSRAFSWAVSSVELHPIGKGCIASEKSTGFAGSVTTCTSV